MSKRHFRREIPWLNVVRFHEEITKRSEEDFFSLSIGAEPSDRWSSLRGFEPLSLAGPWDLTRTSFSSASLYRSIESGSPGDLYIGGPCWIRWRRGGNQWYLQWQPLLYREVRVETDENEALRVVPMEGSWDISPLAFQFLDQRNVQTPVPLDEALTNILEQAQKRLNEDGVPLSDAVIDIMDVAAPELATELKKARDQFPPDRLDSKPEPWVLFSAPSQNSQITQHILRDYELLERCLSQHPQEIGGLRILEDPPKPAEAKAAGVLPIVPLNESQLGAVKGILETKPVTVISGPPGCGKSQVVLSLLLNAWAQGTSVLFASNNNRAVEVIRERLERFETDFPIAVRAGSSQFNNVDESLRRTLNVIASASQKTKTDGSRLIKRRNRLERQKGDLQEFRDTKLPQQVHEAVSAALKAYGQFHTTRSEHQNRKAELVEQLRLLGHDVAPEDFRKLVLGPLENWLAGLDSVRDSINADKQAKRDAARTKKQAIALRNRVLKAVGLDVDQQGNLGWLTSGPDPSLLDEWHRRATEVLSQPLEDRLKDVPWRREYERWNGGEEAESWAEDTEALARDIRRTVAEVTPTLARLRDLQAAYDAQSYQVLDKIGTTDLEVDPTLLSKWLAEYTRWFTLPSSRTAILPWSEKRRLERSLKRLEDELRAVYRLDVWREIGVLDGEGRDRLSEIVQLTVSWLEIRSKWEKGGREREEIERQFLGFRSRSGELRHRSIPESSDMGSWEAFASQLDSSVALAAEACKAWRDQQLKQEVLESLRTLADQFRAIGTGVPLKAVWANGAGARFVEAVVALGVQPDESAINTARQAMYDGSFANLVDSWKQARDTEQEISRVANEISKIPEQAARIREWDEARPPLLYELAVPGEELPGKDDAVWQHLEECRSWQQSWEDFARRLVGEGRNRLATEKQFALDKLSEAYNLVPADYQNDLYSTIKPILDQRSVDWPVEQITRGFDAFVPEQIKAQIGLIDAELERISFDVAKQQWVRRIAAYPEAQDSLEMLRSHLRRNRQRAVPEAYEAFASVLKIQPIWITVAMSAQTIPMVPELYDLVVIDEATQCTLTNMLPLIFRAKRLAVIGDPEQLFPIESIGREAEIQLAAKHEVVDWINLIGHVDNDVYKVAVKGLPHRRQDVIPLSEHYRSHPLVIGFSNQFIYHDPLRLRKEPSHKKRVPSGSGVHAVRVRGNAARGPRGRSWLNLPEANAVCEVVSGLREAKGYGAFSIGVVTPFKPQKEQIQSELERRGLLRDITVDTVHRFQGDERDVMIFSPVVSRAMSEGAKRWVEYPHNLINVAVTRARESFYFVADYDECRIRPGILGRLTRYVETVESLRKSSEAELSLFTEMVTQGWNPDVHVQIGDIKVDFVLERFGRRIAIEVDGEQHKHQAVQDEGRDAFLLGLGYRVLRVPARDVFETPALVIRKIDELLTEDLEVKTPKRGTSATSAADGVSRDDIDLFDERWQPLIENLLEDANIVVEPGCDVLADGRVVGQSLAIVSDGSHQLHLLDGDHPDSRRVRDYLEEQGEHVLVCRSPGIETAHQIRARLHGNDI